MAPAAHEFELPDERATVRLGAALAHALRTHQAALAAHGCVVTLSGDLGAGKTALTRATLRALGVTGPVKSPTFTLLEPYVVSSINFQHFDFYRFADPAEFASAGFRELFGPAGPDGRANVCFVEWPERVSGVLPTPDLAVTLEVQGDGRRCRVRAGSDVGAACLATTIEGFTTGAAAT